ncbi:hypothetical protein AB6A40_007104 [Gnathostoma spinigerum]|uniref:Exportin-1/Importin-beta-like domain-containing protein n=1 Tax=Gnathostoma spinigerum TaxID=75299 RepID=A0ABD6ELH2_9BILA
MNETNMKPPYTIANLVTEFYTTTDCARRQELDKLLNDIKKACPGFPAVFQLLNSSQPSFVQLFGACVLYDVIKANWEEYTSDENAVSILRAALVEKLTSEEVQQNRPLANKLTSSLALFSLYCMPDVWTNPITDLMETWKSRPEVLLKYLTEIAAEFPRTRIPLKQRGILKSSLHSAVKDVLPVLEAVLQSEQAPSSAKNAATECAEQWMRLPGVPLSDWNPVLKSVFHSSLNDIAVLTRILSVLASHEDLLTLEYMVLDICEYLAVTVCPMIINELQSMWETGEKDSAEMEELASLIVALSSFVEVVVRPVLIRAASNGAEKTFRSLCSFFLNISTWPGRYPVDEVISDAPEQFWNALKEELQCVSDDRVTPQMLDKLNDICKNFYAKLLESALDKLAYTPFDESRHLFDKEQLDKFESYRADRMEVSANSYLIIGKDTVNFLNLQLRDALGNHNICRIEVILSLLDRMADYLTSSEMDCVNMTLELCSNIQSWGVHRQPDFLRLGVALTKLIYSLSYLIVTSDDAVRLERLSISLALMFLHESEVTADALKTLEKFCEERCPYLAETADELIKNCYAYFSNEKNPQSSRLSAMKCIGYALSTRDLPFIMDSLNSILAPQIKKLETILSSNILDVPEATASLETEYFFELGVFSVLFASLQDKSDSKPLVDDIQQSPVFIVLSQCLPLFEALIMKFGPVQSLVSKVCDALRAGLVTLGEGSQPLLPAYFRILDSVLLKNATAASLLAKSVILVFSGTSAVSKSLLSKVKSWVVTMRNTWKDSASEDYIELAYHIIKKDWKLLQTDLNDCRIILSAAIDITLQMWKSCNEISIRVTVQQLQL